MTRPIRLFTLSVFLAAAVGASAAGNNPAARGDHSSFFFDGLRQQQSNIGQPLANTNQLARPTSHFGPVTPVPEPSEWTMMLVGLAFVGWIVRRKSKQS